MAYLVSWQIFVLEDDIGPVEAANRAKEMFNTQRYGHMFGVRDAETGSVVCVDTVDSRIIEVEVLE